MPDFNGTNGTTLDISLSDLDDTVDRTDLNAGSLIMPSDAVNTDRFFNNIGIVTGKNSIDRTFWFTYSAIGAAISDSMCHCSSPVYVMKIISTFRSSTFQEIRKGGFPVIEIGIPGGEVVLHILFYALFDWCE